MSPESFSLHLLMYLERETSPPPPNKLHHDLVYKALFAGQNFPQLSFHLICIEHPGRQQRRRLLRPKDQAQQRNTCFNLKLCLNWSPFSAPVSDNKLFVFRCSSHYWATGRGKRSISLDCQRCPRLFLILSLWCFRSVPNFDLVRCLTVFLSHPSSSSPSPSLQVGN